MTFLLIDNCVVHGIKHAQVRITKRVREDLAWAFDVQLEDADWRADNPALIESTERLAALLKGDPTVGGTIIYRVRHEDIPNVLLEIDNRLDIHRGNLDVNADRKERGQIRRLIAGYRDVEKRCKSLWSKWTAESKQPLPYPGAENLAAWME